jgi:hypothetical protein
LALSGAHFASAAPFAESQAFEAELVQGIQLLGQGHFAESVIDDTLEMEFAMRTGEYG